MAQRKKLRELVGILKDKASLVKSTLSMKRTASLIIISVLRATSHGSSSTPPPDHRITAILSLGHGPRPTACICIEAIMDRLHNTRNAFVALKCLILLHNIIGRGSFILKDQLSFYPSTGGRNFLNLSRFRDKTDLETWDFSCWVRWYAGVLERNLMTCRLLGSYFSSSSSSSVQKDIDNGRDNITSSSDSGLLNQIDGLVNMVEEICKTPESLHYQKNNLVYEVMRLVGEDYRSTQYHIMLRLSEFEDRMGGLSFNESAELTSCLKRIRECEERLMLLFGNRKRNEGFWELISETKLKLVKMREEREKEMIMVTKVRKEKQNELTRVNERVLGPSQMFRSSPYGSEWIGVDRFSLTVSTVMR